MSSIAEAVVKVAVFGMVEVGMVVIFPGGEVVELVVVG